jgi:hypothetical protein
MLPCCNPPPTSFQTVGGGGVEAAEVGEDTVTANAWRIVRFFSSFLFFSDLCCRLLFLFIPFTMYYYVHPGLKFNTAVQFVSPKKRCVYSNLIARTLSAMNKNDHVHPLDRKISFKVFMHRVGFFYFILFYYFSISWLDTIFFFFFKRQGRSSSQLEQITVFCIAFVFTVRLWRL